MFLALSSITILGIAAMVVLSALVAAIIATRVGPPEEWDETQQDRRQLEPLDPIHHPRRRASDHPRREGIY